MFAVTLVFLGLLSAQPLPPDSAALELQNRTILVFRASLGAAGPHERVEAALRRIREAGTDTSTHVTTRPFPEGALILVGGRPAFAVTPGDVDTAAGVTVNEAAAAAATRLRTALEETREARSLSALGKALTLALLATIIFSVLIVILVRVRRRLRVWIEERAANAARQLMFRGITLLRSDQLIRAGGALTTFVVWFIGLAACYGYVTYVLTRFPWTRPWGELLGQYVVNSVRRLGGAALDYIPDLITLALIILATRVATRLVRALFQASEQGRIALPWIHPDISQPTRRLVTAFLWLLALVLAYPYLPGSRSAAFKGVSVFAGLLITLGSTGLVGQAMSGLVLMYSRSFKAGDFVRVNQLLGTVVSLGILSTRIRTVKNEYVTIPNSVVIAGSITNYSFGTEQGQPLVLYSSITIGYDVPWRKVHDLLLEAARRTEEALAQPAPWVLQQALNDWTVEYQVNVAIDPASAAKIPGVYSVLHANIQDTFREAGIEITSPEHVAVREAGSETGSDGRGRMGRRSPLPGSLPKESAGSPVPPVPRAEAPEREPETLAGDSSADPPAPS